MHKRTLIIALLLACFALPAPAPALAQTGTKISQMPSGGAILNTDSVPFVRGGVNFKGTIASSVGSTGAVQTNNGAGGFASFLLSNTVGTGSATNGVLFNAGSTTQTLTQGTNPNNGWTNQISPAPLAAQALYQVSQGLYVDPRNYGAVCNAQIGGQNTYVPHVLHGVTLTASSPVISIPGYTWKLADVGSFVAVNGGFAGDAGVGTGTIISVNLVANTATMSVTPTISTTGGEIVFGADDTSGFVAAANQAVLNGGYVVVPNNCLVREMHLPNAVTLLGQAQETDYNYNYITPVMYVLSTGFTEDSTSYGINITNSNGIALSGFEIRALVDFPEPASSSGFANENAACIGTDSGTASVRAGVVLDHMSIQNCFVGLGVRIPNTSTGHIFFESRYSEFSTDAWGMHGGFSDGMEIGDVFTGNHEGYGDVYWGQGGGFATTAMRLIGVRFEEGGGLYCDACTGNHLDGVQFQFEAVNANSNGFTTGNSIVLNGQWNSFWMTGGFIEPADTDVPHIGVRLSGFGNFSHPVASFVNVFMGANANFIDYESTSSNQTIEYLGGITIAFAFTDVPITGPNFVHAGTGVPWVTKYQPANSPQYIAGVGVTDFTVNANHALGLMTTNANFGTILDMGLANTTTNSSIILPSASTSNRPVTGIAGMIRYNTTIPALEAFFSSAWNTILSYTASTIAATGSITFSNGLILNWGPWTSAASQAAVAVTYNAAFTTATYAVLPACASASTTSANAWYDTPVNSGVNLRGQVGSLSCTYFALGK